MVKEAIVINRKNSIAKEMETVKIAFQILANGENAHDGYQLVNCHMVFCIKMENFRRKACLIVGGHVTQTQNIIAYSSAVTRETVRIALKMRGQSSSYVECLYDNN